MQEHQSLPTLLGYLDPSGSPARLNMALGGEGVAPVVDQRFPFFLVSDSDPLTRVLRARFETDAGSLIRSVFLLVQKDRYSQAASPLGRLTNMDAELFWQNAIQQLQTTSSEWKPILLSGRTRSDGKPLPFKSLFFCRTRGIFFHPPCPHCGGELTLCQDDEWLASNRLRPYTTSLSRYLHCPACRRSGAAPLFYAHEPDAFDPPLVKDRWALIQEYGHMGERELTSAGFPCLDCAQAGTCLRSAEPLSATLIPFAFYPFYLLAFETMTFHAPDFLCLASGGSLDELKERLIQRGEMGKVHHLEVEMERWSGRHDSFFFFQKTDKFFLETLYLKLAFLAEVAQMAIFERGGPGLVDLVGSLDRIWVKLPSQNSTLPRFWNFQVGFLDIFRGAPGVPPQLRLPPTYALHLMGVLWFTALLTNRTQDAPVIQQAIDVFYNDQMQASEESADAWDAPYRSNPVFQPGNLLWNPEDLELPEPREKLWHQALGLGWWLMRAGYRMSPDWSPERFQERLASLLESVKKELFSAGSRTEPSAEPEDGLLAALLADLLKKWESPIATAEMQQEERVAPQRIGTPGFSEDATLPLDFYEKSTEEWGPETVILSPSRAEPSEAPAAPPGDQAAETPGTPLSHIPNDLISEETIVLRSGKSEAEQEDILPETVILSPGAGIGRKDTSSPRENHTGPPAEPMKTPDVPEPPESEAAQAAAAADEHDLMMETVILRPKINKD